MAERDKIDIPEGRFPSNSSLSSIRPPARPKAEPEEEPIRTLDGTIKPQKKSLMRRIADAFIATDRKDIKDYLVFDILIPGLKRGLEDVVHMMLYNDKKSPHIERRRGESRIRRLEFNSLRDARRDDDEMLGSRLIAGECDLIFTTRSKAEEALDMVTERIEDRGFATLKYYYTITRQPTDWTQENWGWRSMAGAKVVEVRGGYKLRMPRLEEI